MLTLSLFSGADDIKYDRIGWSKLSKPPGSWLVDRVQITAGQYITLGVGFVPGKEVTPIRLKNDYYAERLAGIGSHFFVLHDVDPAVRKAWLLDGLSTLLHLVRRYLAHNWSDADSQALKPLLPAKLESRGGRSGREVALETLICRENRSLKLLESNADSKPRSLEDLVKSFLHLLEQVVDHQSDRRTDTSLGIRVDMSPRAQMVGFDFADLAMDTHLIESRTATLLSDGEEWTELTRAICAPTLFGRNFGDIWEPEPLQRNGGKCVACHLNCSVPPLRDILAVSMSDLDRIVERRGEKHDHYWRVVDELCLDNPSVVFRNCLVTEGYGCQTPERIQKPRTGSRFAAAFSNQKNGRGGIRRSIDLTSAIRSALKIEDPFRDIPVMVEDISKGALLLGRPGRPQNRLRKRRGLQKADADGEAQPRVAALTGSSSILTCDSLGSSSSLQAPEILSLGPHRSFQAGDTSEEQLETSRQDEEITERRRHASVVLNLSVPTQHDIPHPVRRIVLTPLSPSVELGRSDGSPNAAPGFSNGWFDCPVMSGHHANIEVDFAEQESCPLLDVL